MEPRFSCVVVAEKKNKRGQQFYAYAFIVNLVYVDGKHNVHHSVEVHREAGDLNEIPFYASTTLATFLAIRKALTWFLKTSHYDQPTNIYISNRRSAEWLEKKRDKKKTTTNEEWAYTAKEALALACMFYQVTFHHVPKESTGAALLYLEDTKVAPPRTPDDEGS